MKDLEKDLLVEYLNAQKAVEYFAETQTQIDEIFKRLDKLLRKIPVEMANAVFESEEIDDLVDRMLALAKFQEEHSPTFLARK